MASLFAPVLTIPAGMGMRTNQKSDAGLFSIDRDKKSNISLGFDHNKTPVAQACRILYFGLSVVLIVILIIDGLILKEFISSNQFVLQMIFNFTDPWYELAGYGCILACIIGADYYSS